MANQHKHALRGIRKVPEADWTDFAAATEAAGTDRSTEVAEWIRWYLHRPGAREPQRPPKSEAG